MTDAIAELGRLREALEGGREWEARNRLVRLGGGVRDGRKLSLPRAEEHARGLVSDVGIDRAEVYAKEQVGQAEHWMAREHYRGVVSVLVWLRAVAGHEGR